MTLCLFGCVCRIQCSQPRSWLRRTADWRAFVRKAWNLLQYASEKKKRRFYGSACGTCRDAKVRFLDLRHLFRHEDVRSTSCAKITKSLQRFFACPFFRVSSV